jgi:hypothetical protein
MSNDGQQVTDADVDRARRSFFREFVADAMSKVREMRGIRQFRLSQIHTRPEHVIAAMVPSRPRLGRIRVQGNRLVQCRRDGTPEATLLELGEQHTRLLSHFDGLRSVRQIARDWAAETGLPEAEAFAQVKSFFLPLAKLAVLVPISAPEPED